MAETLQSCLYIVGCFAIVFGLLGWNAVARGWADDDVTRRDYVQIGTAALCVGGLIIYFATKVA